MKLYFVVSLLLPIVVFAGEADVVKVDITARGASLYKFNVTVAHKDEGWEHYVDMWEIMSPDGTLLGKRTIFNPHEEVSSFSSSLVGVKIPSEIKEVTVRAHDTKHAYQGKKLTVVVPQ